jgi:ELWxxDGT repeat protein
MRLRQAGLAVEPLEERRLLAATPELLADLGRGDGSSIRSATEVNGIYYFSLREGQTSDTPSRLWRSDGTAEGTWVIRDFTDYHPTSGAVLPVNFNGTLFFRGPGTSGSALWKSDGTAAGTEIVKENVGWGRTVVAGDTLIFADYDNRLWRSDGTSAGTYVLASFGPSSPAILSSDLTVAGDEVYFTAEGPADASQLWKSDGTTAGTVLVKEFATGTYNMNLDASIGFEGRVFFSVGDPTIGRELWVSDGTEAGTTLVKDIRPGVGDSKPRSFVEYAGELYLWPTMVRTEASYGKLTEPKPEP